MQIEITNMETQDQVSALERAITHLEYNLRHASAHCLGLTGIEHDIQTLEMMKVAYLLIQRNAAKEQRQERANGTYDRIDAENDLADRLDNRNIYPA